MTITSILLAVYAVRFSLSAPGRVKWEKRILSRTLPFLIHPLISVEGLKRVNENKKCSIMLFDLFSLQSSLGWLLAAYSKSITRSQRRRKIMILSVSRPRPGWKSSQMAPNHIRHLKLFRICLVSNCFMSRYETFGSLSDMWTCLTRSGAFKSLKCLTWDDCRIGIYDAWCFSFREKGLAMRSFNETNEAGGSLRCKKKHLVSLKEQICNLFFEEHCYKMKIAVRWTSSCE